MNLPKLIQGGMGVAISDWRLAKAVSKLGQLGVVSGTGISRVLASRLMDGDVSGNVRRAQRYCCRNRCKILSIITIRPVEKQQRRPTKRPRHTPSNRQNFSIK